ncbi:MAG: arginine deiminase family protein [Longimicrobiales bacterium]
MDARSAPAPVLALTRPVSPTLAACELTHRERVPIDVERAAAQHAGYEAALEAAGCRLVPVPAAPALPDAVFVEDTAVVVDEVAVLTRPGAASRRPEVDGVAAVLAAHRPVERIEAPGTLDGGDVLVVGRDAFVGASQRTNDAGTVQLRSILGPLGYAVRSVPVTGCLHLKTAVTALTDDLLVVNPAWVDPGAFGERRVLEVAPGEPLAANVLRLPDRVLMAAGQPGTRARLRAALAEVGAGDVGVVEVDVSELARAEAGISCCSILLG